MRALIINPLLLALSAVIGLLVCRTLRWNSHPREMVWALLICFSAAEAGLVLLLLHRALGIHPAQAGLLATVAHLMLSTMVGGLVLLLLHPPLAFAFWLLTFYWLSLIVVAVAAIRLVRSAPISEPVAGRTA